MKIPALTGENSIGYKTLFSFVFFGYLFEIKKEIFVEVYQLKGEK